MIRHLLRTALAVACLAEAELLTRRARLVRRVGELERRLATALAAIEREAVGVDVDAWPTSTVAVQFECEICAGQVSAVFPILGGEPQPTEAACAPCGIRYSCEHTWADDEDGGHDAVNVRRWWCRHEVDDATECAGCDGGAS